MTLQLRWALNVWPLVLGSLLTIGANRFEYMYLPVVEDFTVTKMERRGEILLMSGYMRKTRACEFAGVIAEGLTRGGTEVSLPIVFRDNHGNDTANRPTGTQAWGPWSIEVPLAPPLRELHITATHKCHPLWSTDTDLLSIPITGGDQ